MIAPFEEESDGDGARQSRSRRWSRGSKSLLADVLVVALACATLGYIATLAGGETEASHGRYLTAPVVRGTLTVKVHATGTVEPTRLIDVSTELSGTLRRVLVKPNDVVKTGQVLAELDPSYTRAQVARARAVVAAARAKLQEGQADARRSTADLGRKQRLHANRHTSERDLDSAEFASSRAVASVERLRAEIEMAEADLQIAEANLTKSRIVSPVNGVVLRRNAEPGQTIAASLQPPVLFRIAEDLTEMQIRVDVDEADSMNVAAGQMATFSVQALRKKRFVAKVERIHIGPEVVQGVVTYKAILTFDNRRIKLKPGMTAAADISVDRVRDALLVPNAALRFSPTATLATPPAPILSQALGIAPANGAQPPPEQAEVTDQEARGTSEAQYIYVIDAGRLRRIAVEVGPTDGTSTAVSAEGLTAGQRVVIDIADTGS